MPSFRALVGAGRSALAARLDRLQRTLAVLGERLRGTVAQALGETVAETVRATFLSAVAEVEEPAHARYHQPYAAFPTSPSGYWRDPADAGWDGDDYGSDFHDRDQYRRGYHESHRDPYDCPVQANDPAEYSPDAVPETPVQALPPRLAVALATGLRTASLWLRRCCGRGTLVIAALVGLAAAGAAYLGGGVVEAGLGLIESVGHVAALGEAARRGTATLVSGRPR